MAGTDLMGYSSKCITPINPHINVVKYKLLLFHFIDEMNEEIDI